MTANHRRASKTLATGWILISCSRIARLCREADIHPGADPQGESTPQPLAWIDVFIIDLDQRTKINEQLFMSCQFLTATFEVRVNILVARKGTSHGTKSSQSVIRRDNERDSVSSIALAIASCGLAQSVCYSQTADETPGQLLSIQTNVGAGYNCGRVSSPLYCYGIPIAIKGQPSGTIWLDLIFPAATPAAGSSSGTAWRTWLKPM